MSNANTEIDNWLVAADLDQELLTDEVWESGFDADRQIIYSKLGPYKRIFLRPEKFVKRFYHTLYPLPIEKWQCVDKVKLYDGFCTVDIILDIRFQATFKYALSHIEILSELNEHIKAAYHDLALDIVNRELLKLPDGSWVQKGLDQVQNKAAALVSEMLVLNNIQSQTVCKLKASFESFPDVQFAKENVYLCVLKKNFEFSEQEAEELFRQQQEQEKQKIEHKRIQLEQLAEIAVLDRQKQAKQAEHAMQLLVEKRQQQIEQAEIKKIIHEEKVRHNNRLKEMTLVAELELKQAQQIRVRENEAKERLELIAQQTRLKEKALEASIAEYERKQASWREVKKNIHAEELELKHSQRQLELEREQKKRNEQQRIAIQEENAVVNNNADIYLKKEIEVLELEKQRLALQASIEEYKEKGRQMNVDVEG